MVTRSIIHAATRWRQAERDRRGHAIYIARRHEMAGRRRVRPTAVTRARYSVSPTGLVVRPRLGAPRPRSRHSPSAALDVNTCGMRTSRRGLTSPTCRRAAGSASSVRCSPSASRSSIRRLAATSPRSTPTCSAGSPLAPRGAASAGVGPPRLLYRPNASGRAPPSANAAYTPHPISPTFDVLLLVGPVSLAPSGRGGAPLDVRFGGQPGVLPCAANSVFGLRVGPARPRMQLGISVRNTAINDCIIDEPDILAVPRYQHTRSGSPDRFLP